MDFENLYKEYWSKVFRLCMGYVNDSDLAKDLSQDTFITVYQKLPTFRNESAIGTWIFRIASNTCLGQLEKQKLMPTDMLPLQLEDKPDVSIEARVQFLYACIAELPEVDRLIISLELEEEPQARIAEILGLTEANVRVKIHRIKEKLAKKFETHEH
jgi:RNA polymerase sigma-70 factor (ECF subfamily)